LASNFQGLSVTKGCANAYVIIAGVDGNDIGGIDEDLFGIFASK